MTNTWANPPVTDPQPVTTPGPAACEPTIEAHRVVARITADGRGTVLLDGHDLDGVLDGFTLTFRHGQPAVIRLDLGATVRATAWGTAVNLPPTLREALVALGWTPPAREAR